jgi:endonuclease YncB( thermonuclease family)
MANLATRIVLALIVIALLTQLPGLAAAEISGPAKVIDGDTIKIRGAKIRLHGIDAPESAQVCETKEKSYRCGTSATLALARRISGKSVSCDERDRDRYGRIVAVCHAGGEDLNAWLVAWF